jgi:predicted DsbA family dithiol-disulfide isomerase
MKRVAPRAPSILARLVAVLALCAGCGGAQTEARPPEPTAKPKAGAESACSEYAQQLCQELGARSDACRSALGVVAVMPDAACAAGMAEFDVTKERIAELRKACEAVVARVCSELGPESEACGAIRADLPQIPPGHCAALLRDQERLLTALRQRESLNAPLSDELWRALGAGTPPGFGPADAKVLVVEFSDFQCPFCAEAAQTVHKLKEQYGTRIRFVFRQFPLSFHADARGAAQASLAAHDQGKFWEYHDLLFAHQDALGSESLLAHARAAGLDIAAFTAAAGGSSTAERVAEDLRLGESVRIQGTPTLFVDKQRISDPLDYESVSQAVERALAAHP